tara:strand:+ start:11303 stop:13891 length:2589 start_codon:yes stop_codon:yes gene_type:complete
MRRRAATALMTSRAMFRAPRAMDSSDGGLARRTMMTRMRMRMGTLEDRARGFAARAVTRAARENGGDDTVRSTRGVDARSGARDEANDDEFARGTDWATRLSPEDARAELERLDAELAMHDERYYNDAMPTIDDAEYDGLRARYEAIERAHPAAARARGASARVGATPDGASGSRKISHEVPMRSLGNAFDVGQVEAFVKRVEKARGEEGEGAAEYCAEPKVDGASASLRYEDGKLVYAVSRGDGEVGEDVTRHLVGARGVPAALVAPYPKVLEIRGEVHVAEEDFRRVNAERAATGARVFKNARNAAAGAMRMLNAEDNQMPLRFLAYGWGAVGDSKDRVETPWSTQSEFLSEFLPRQKFDAVPCLGVVKSLDELIEAYDASEIARPTMPYEIDGVVYKVNDVRLQEALGADARQPRWAIAHKFTAMSAVTVLRAIEIQVGRTGALTPVAVLDPVDIGGASISRATLHNFDEIARKKLKIGARVTVERAGDVIPRVASLAGDDLAEASSYDDDAPPLPEWLPPKTCPDCGSSVVRAPLSASKTAMGSIVRCTGGLKCPSQSMERLLHFCSRNALDIRGLARGTLETLHREGVVKTLADIFTLERRFGPQSGEAAPTWWRYAGVKNAKGEIKEGSDGLKQSAIKLFEAIELRRRGVPLHRFVYALGIPNIGAHTAKVLANHYGTLEALRKAASAAVKGGPESLAHAALTHIDGVGPVLAQSLVDFWGEPANASIVDEILAHGVVVIPVDAKSSTERTAPSSPSEPSTAVDLGGAKIVFTGAVEGRARDDIHALIERNNGIVASSISRTTTLVLAGTAAGPRKLTKARELDVPVVAAAAFLDALARGDAAVENWRDFTPPSSP